jgi:hypothetical protein
LAHLARDTAFALEHGSDDLPLRFKLWFGKAFDLAADIAHFAASTIASKKRALENQLADILGAATQCDLARRLQAKIGRARDQLLTFCDYPGEVEATNNGSERKPRPCVIQRKVTNGYRAMWAAKAEADVRTTVDTARLRGANPFQTILDIGPTPQISAPKKWGWVITLNSRLRRVVTMAWNVKRMFAQNTAANAPTSFAALGEEGMEHNILSSKIFLLLHCY